MELYQLYEKAFAFQSLKLWERVEDDQLFAVQVRDQICYINIMGMLGQHYALAVYPGQEGVDSLWRIYQADSMSDVEKMAAGFGQTSLQCEFVPRNELEPAGAQPVFDYVKANGISMRGKRSGWPQFLHHRPYRVAKVISGEAEMEMLEAALDGACWLNGQMNLRSLSHLFEEPETIPLLRRDGGSWRMEMIPAPKEPALCYPIGHTPNDLYRARVQRLPRKGKWACKLIVYPSPSPAEGTEEEVIPWELLAVNIDSEKPVDVQRVRDYETRTDVMLDKLMEAMFRENACPKTICVFDDRTYSLLEDWTAEMGIDLSMEDREPTVLEHLEAYRMSETNPEGVAGAMNEMLDMLLSLPDHELFLNQPQQPEFIENFHEMLDSPGLPEEVRSRVAALLERYERYTDRNSPKVIRTKKGRSRRKKLPPEKSMVISVSLGTGCYRHIQISSHALLSDLSDEILSAFEFDNDHAHAFFMDNRVFSQMHAYYMRGIDDGFPCTDETALAEAGLRAGQQFKYLFDFGDEWLFQCKILKELDQITDSPKIIRWKGDPPEQYPDWDDEDDDWDDEDDWDGEDDE